MTKKKEYVHYSEELAREICATIAKNGDGLKQLCARHPHWPDRDTVFEWMKTHKEFSDWYAQAKREQIEAFIDDIIEISDNTKNDTLIKKSKDGSEFVTANNEWIQRSRLRVDTRKWLASKLMPKLYGDKGLGGELAESFMQKIIDKL